jgi:acyl-CoA synthetase (AMP-forming)/AMP-acid ligase II
LFQRWSDNAARDPSREAVVHFCAGEPARRFTWGALVAGALVEALRLAEAGVRRGDVCALLLRHTPRFYALYLGISALGAIPSVLAYPNARLHPDKLVHGLTGMARRSGLDWVLTEAALEPVVGPLLTGQGSSVRGLLFPLDWPAPGEGQSAGGFAPAAPDPDETCLLQHSSGTTGLQKAVALSHRAVLGHVRRYGAAIGLSPDDKVASWLPLYHDMGLIAAFHLPLAAAVPTIQLDPFEWIAAPHLLLQAMSEERATIAWLPNFAYDFTAQRADEDELAALRLDSVRLFVNCSEPVRAASHAKLLARLAPLGLREGALSACYAMAETTFAATQTRPGARARELSVSRDDLGRGVVSLAEPGAQARLCVSSGAPITDVEVRVVGEGGEALPEGRVGELYLRSASMFEGYRNDPEKTAAALDDGWYKSGDDGFVWEGEVYVAGRRKDLIIVAGKNLYPEDIEDAVGAVQGVLPGRVVAFAIDDEQTGTEAVCVVAETDREGEAERKALRLAILRAGMAIDVTIAEAHLAPPRWLVKSSSGKPSRKTNRERLLAGELAGAKREV